MSPLPPDDTERVRAYLSTRPVEDLVERLVNTASIIDEVWLGLVTEARIVTGDLDMAHLKKELTASVRVSGYMHWRQVPAYADRIDAVIELISALLGAGHATQAVEVTEHVIARFDTAMGHIDDSGGYLAAAHERLQTLHLAACVAARPDPRKLGARLVDLALKGHLEWFLDAPVAYADVLGDRGLAGYRTRLDKYWSTFPQLEPGDRRWGFEPDGPSRFRVTHLKMSLARAMGDINELVEIMARDLSSAWCFVEIADELTAAGREREALVWLERGHAAFPPDGGDRRLRHALIAAYRRDGLDDEAVAIARGAFDVTADSSTFEELRMAADGTPAWDELRATALRHLRGEDDAGGRLRESGRSSVVRIMIDEGDVEQAWRDATQGGCTETLWMELAELRCESHPDDALDVYWRHLGRVLQHADVGNYRVAVHLLKRIEATLTGAGRALEFSSSLAGVRFDNRRRPKLIELLDHAWPNPAG
jgi:hypothetical protein